MLEEVLAYLHNWFEVARIIGAFTIEDGKIILNNISLKEGQYVRIMGSVLNDGVHAAIDTLIDEEFDGAVWVLNIPPHILQLVTEIEAWEKKNADVGAYQSESFGGYSYSLMTDASGAPASWKTKFKSRLNHYRKVR